MNPLPEQKLECAKVTPLLGGALDGALDAAMTVTVDDHIAACADCHEQFRVLRALRGSLKKVVRAAAPSDFRARMEARLAAEAAETVSEAAVADAVPASDRTHLVAPPSSRRPSLPMRPRSRLASLRVFAPWAAAAAVVMGLGTYQQHRAAARRGVDGPLGDFLAEHARPLPPETKEIQGLGTYVGVPIHSQFSKRATLVGGRVFSVQRERAAQLQYEVAGPSGGRVSIFVYDPRKLQIDSSDLAARQRGTNEVRVGRANGYSVAVSEHDGVGYAVTADMDPDLAADLAAELDQ
jgi:anti-sigma factor RsiW